MPRFQKQVTSADELTNLIGEPSACDVSSRGDAYGLAKVLDSHTLVIPDRRGNRRVDSLRNILETGRVGLLFLIPGMGDGGMGDGDRDGRRGHTSFHYMTTQRMNIRRCMVIIFPQRARSPTMYRAPFGSAQK